jgi:hypothetical protein
MIRFSAIWLAITIAMVTLFAPAPSFAEDKDARAKIIGECHKAALKVYPDKRSPEHQAAMARGPDAPYWMNAYSPSEMGVPNLQERSPGSAGVAVEV